MQDFFFLFFLLFSREKINLKTFLKIYDGNDQRFGLASHVFLMTYFIMPIMQMKQCLTELTPITAHLQDNTCVIKN